MVGTYRHLARAIARTKLAVPAFAQVFVTTHHGDHDHLGLLSKLQPDFCTLIGLLSATLGIIYLPAILAILDRSV